MVHDMGHVISPISYGTCYIESLAMGTFRSFERLGLGGWWVHLDYNISSGPFSEF